MFFGPMPLQELNVLLRLTVSYDELLYATRIGHPPLQFF